MRAVLDPNVIVAGLLSGESKAAAILWAWRRGAFELILSPYLLKELARTLDHPKVGSHINRTESEATLKWLADSAVLVADSEDDPPYVSRDSGDNYLLALAASTQSALVSGDKHLLGLVSDGLPIFSPSVFLGKIR